jgi:hypothetical protein
LSVQALVTGSYDSTVLPEEVMLTAYSSPPDATATGVLRANTMLAAALQLAACANAVLGNANSAPNASNQRKTHEPQRRPRTNCIAASYHRLLATTVHHQTKPMLSPR